MNVCKASSHLGQFGQHRGSHLALVGGSDGIIELGLQSTLGRSQDTLEVLSQIDASIHTEQITIISRNGEQKSNPDLSDLS